MSYQAVAALLDLEYLLQESSLSPPTSPSSRKAVNLGDLAVSVKGGGGRPSPQADRVSLPMSGSIRPCQTRLLGTYQPPLAPRLALTITGARRAIASRKDSAEPRSTGLFGCWPGSRQRNAHLTGKNAACHPNW